MSLKQISEHLVNYIEFFTGELSIKSNDISIDILETGRAKQRGADTRLCKCSVNEHFANSDTAIVSHE